MSPTVVDVVVVVLTTAILGEETGIVTVLESADPLSVRPSGKVEAECCGSLIDQLLRTRQ